MIIIMITITTIVITIIIIIIDIMIIIIAMITSVRLIAGLLPTGLPRAAARLRQTSTTAENDTNITPNH